MSQGPGAESADAPRCYCPVTHNSGDSRSYFAERRGADSGDKLYHRQSCGWGQNPHLFSAPRGRESAHSAIESGRTENRYSRPRYPDCSWSERRRPIHSRDVQRLVRVAAQKAGIRRNVTPHTLRHTFATRVLQQSGADLATLSA
nr:tyrosine-type recombinase/integrase [Anaerolineae bacterium]